MSFVLEKARLGRYIKGIAILTLNFMPKRENDEIE